MVTVNDLLPGMMLRVELTSNPRTPYLIIAVVPGEYQVTVWTLCNTIEVSRLDLTISDIWAQKVC